MAYLEKYWNLYADRGEYRGWLVWTLAKRFLCTWLPTYLTNSTGTSFCMSTATTVQVVERRRIPLKLRWLSRSANCDREGSLRNSSRFVGCRHLWIGKICIKQGLVLNNVWSYVSQKSMRTFNVYLEGKMRKNIYKNFSSFDMNLSMHKIYIKRIGVKCPCKQKGSGVI